MDSSRRLPRLRTTSYSSIFIDAASTTAEQGGVLPEAHIDNSIIMAANSHQSEVSSRMSSLELEERVVLRDASSRIVRTTIVRQYALRTAEISETGGCSYAEWYDGRCFHCRSCLPRRYLSDD